MPVTTPATANSRSSSGVSNVYRRAPTSLHLRPPERIRHLLTGWHIVDPGIVPVHEWHADPDDFQPHAIGMVAAVGHKR